MTYRESTGEDRSVLVIGLNGRVFGLDAATGARRWEHEIGHGEVEILVHGGRVYAIAATGGMSLACIDYASGQMIGLAPLPSTYRGRATMLLERDRLFVATRGELFALTLDGQLVWSDGFKGKGVGSMSLGFPDNVRQADDAGSR